jgi:competence protein ComEC
VKLLYIVVATLVGIALGRLSWEMGASGCDTPGWLWPAALALLPLTAGLNRLLIRDRAIAPLRWPVAAGFVPPRPEFTPALAAALGVSLALGVLRYAAQPLTPCWTPADLAYYNLPAGRAYDRRAPAVTLEGTVSRYPLAHGNARRVELTVTQLDAGAGIQPVQGRLQVDVPWELAPVYGQRMRVTGRLVTPPDFAEFSYREVLARRGVHSLLVAAEVMTVPGPPGGSWLIRALYALRARGETLLARLLPEPYAALAKGILVGVESEIPAELYDQFTATGTSHVLVISGSNLALVAGMLMAGMQRVLGRRRAAGPVLAGIAGYTLLVGGDAAVMRAAGMAGLVVVAGALGRRSTALIGLAAAAWAMALANPTVLWDVGFQLSAAATLGLAIFTRPFSAAFGRLWPGANANGAAGERGGWLRALVWDGAVVTLAANALVLPLVAYHFGRVSLLGLAANVLVAPVQPLILVGGMAGLGLGLAGLVPVAQAVLWGAWLGLAWTVAVVRWTAALPGASLAVAGYGASWLWATYALILALLLHVQLAAAARRLAVQPARWLGQGALAGGGMAALLVWLAVLSLPDGRLHVWFLDVGQGDAIVIQTPGGRQVLVDGGSDPRLLLAELGAVLPFWDRSLDLLALTHPDEDHMAAQAAVAARFRIGQVLDTAASQANPDGAVWRAAMAAAQVPVTVTAAGCWVELGDGAALWVLNPPAAPTQPLDENESSLVLKLVYGDFSVLLTGDAGLASEAAWLAQGVPLAATVLKAGHHGSASSSGSDFVAAVNPQFAVIQVGENRYGHPAAEVLARLAGRTLLRTDHDGRIHLVSDGREVWLATARHR